MTKLNTNFKDISMNKLLCKPRRGLFSVWQDQSYIFEIQVQWSIIIKNYKTRSIVFQFFVRISRISIDYNGLFIQHILETYLIVVLFPFFLFFRYEIFVIQKYTHHRYHDQNLIFVPNARFVYKRLISGARMKKKLKSPKKIKC